MKYPKHEFTVKNGLKIEIQTPAPCEAAALRDFIVAASGQTPFLLSDT